jgi:hypothetical protein
VRPAHFLNFDLRHKHPHNKKALGIYFGNYDPGFKFYDANRLSEIILSLSHKREKDEAAPIKVPADSCRP